MKYTAVFYTGSGIGQIWSHTITPYYLHINALNEEDAINKIIKEANKNYKYNKCFGATKCGIETKDKIGVLFIKDRLIRWVGDEVFKSPQVYGILPYKVHISETKYIFDGDWVVNNVFGSLYPTFKAYMEHVYEYMNHEAFGETAQQRLDKYYYPLLNKI